MSRYRLLGFSGAIVLAALVGGTLINAVSAAPSAPGTVAAAAAPDANAAAADGTYCKVYRAALAKALGVSETSLADAGREAAAATIAQAVADGKLTKAAADRLTARLAAATGDACLRLAKRLDRVKPALGAARDAMTAAADVLGMRPAELRTQLRDGASLKTIASSKGVDYAKLSAAILDAVKTDLGAAVKAGTIPQARADKVLDRLAARLADGQLRRGD